MDTNKHKNKKKQITTIFLTGHVSRTMVIPIEMAKNMGLDKWSHVTVEEVPEGGLLIKKLEIPE